MGVCPVSTTFSILNSDHTLTTHASKQKHASFLSRVRPPGCNRLHSSPREDEVPLLDLRRRTKSSKPLDLRRGERTCEDVRVE